MCVIICCFPSNSGEEKKNYDTQENTFSFLYSIELFAHAVALCVHTCIHTFSSSVFFLFFLLFALIVVLVVMFHKIAYKCNRCLNRFRYVCVLDLIVPSLGLFVVHLSVCLFVHSSIARISMQLICKNPNVLFGLRVDVG